jgi:putative multiple sugar transport system substrate-binding protein
MKRKYLLGMLAVLLTISMVLSACTPAAPAAPAEPAAPAAELAVGIVLPTKDEPRWVQDETRFKEALTAAGYQVEILFSQGDSAKEKANVESLITKGVKVLIICPQDGTAAAAAADAAKAAGVKVISYDRLIRETAAVDYYVTFDSIAVGAQQAQYLVDNATGAGNPLYLYAGAASDNNAFIFFEGAWGVLQPKIADGTFVIKNSSEAVTLQSKATLTRDEMSKIIGQVTTNWDFNTAKGLAEANLTVAKAADKGNVFILAPNDGTARAIADAFGADKDVKSFAVTGQDAEKASVQYIIDGKQSMTVFKDVRTLVKDAIGAAVALLEGTTPASKGSYNNGKVDVPAIQSAVVTVDKMNVKAALVDSGYYPATDFTGLDAAAAPAAPAADAGLDALIADAQKEGELTVIALPHDWCNYGEAITAFAAKYNIKVNELNPDAGSGDEIEAVKANKDNTGPQAPDVIDVGYGFGPQLIEEKLVQPYKVSTWDSIPADSKDPDGNWYGDYYGVLAFEVNSDIVTNVPQDWADLLKPEFKGQVALAGDPRASAQAQMSVLAASLANGGSVDDMKPGLDFFKQLNDAGNFVPVIAKQATVAKGETPVIMRWDYSALSDKDTLAGNPNIEVVVPKTGVVAGVYIQAISAYAPHPNAAKLWMEYLYSDEGQLVWLKGYCHPIRYNDMSERGVVPEELSAKLPSADLYAKAVFPSIDQINSAKTVIAEQWMSAVGADVK